MREGLEGLEPHFEKMQAAARRVIRAGEGDRPDVATVREGLAVILDNEAEYLRRMDRVVGLYESEARGRVENLRRISWAVTGLTLATLAAIGLFILRPAVELIRRQVDELGQVARRPGRPGPGADPRAGGWPPNGTGRSSNSSATSGGRRDRRNGVRAGPRAQSAARGDRQLRRGLPGRARIAEQPAVEDVRIALEKLLAATLRAGTDHRADSQVRDPPRTDAANRSSRTASSRRSRRSSETRPGSAGSRVTLDLAPDLPCLWGDPVQIQQVLVNLVRNAFEAIAAAQPLSRRCLYKPEMADRGGVEFARN